MTVAPNRKALVTGGASGFGFGLARRLADHGAGVVIGDISAEGLERARHEDPRLTPVQVDVTDAASVRAAAMRAEEHLGGLDTLAICAGVIHVKPFEEVAEADWDTTLSINLKGAFLTAQAAMPALRASGRGRVVAISSDAGRRGYPWIQAYAASKAGLIGLMQSIAIEVAADRVTVNCVCRVLPDDRMGRSLTEWKAKRVGKSVEETCSRTSPRRSHSGGMSTRRT